MSSPSSSQGIFDSPALTLGYPRRWIDLGSLQGAALAVLLMRVILLVWVLPIALVTYGVLRNIPAAPFSALAP